MPKYEPLFVVRSDMSHMDIFHDVAGKVIPLVTDHPHGWRMDRHFHPVRKLDRWCPCCLAKCEVTIVVCGVCESCVTAWRLSIVSRYMRDCVMAHGRSKPRWRQECSDEERRVLGWKGGTGGLRDGKGEAGYEPHS